MSEIFGQVDFWGALSVANWREIGAALSYVAVWRCASRFIARNSEQVGGLTSLLAFFALGSVFGALARPFDAVAALYCVAALGFAAEIWRLRRARRSAELAKRRAEAERRRRFWDGSGERRSHRRHSRRGERSGRSSRSEGERSYERRGTESAEN